MSTVNQNTQVALIPNEPKPILNHDDLLALGQEALRQLASGTSALGRANALMTHLIAQAWMTKTFECTIDYKDAPEVFAFDIPELSDPNTFKKPDGKNDNKKSKAMFDAVAYELFGVEEFTASQLLTFKTCLTIVSHIHDLGYEMTEIELSKSKYLTVPYEIMVPEPKAENENDWNRYQKLKGTAYALDGKGKNTFAELKRRVTPNKAPLKGANTDKSKTDKGKSFASSLNFINSSVKTFLNDEGEADIALDLNLEKQMHDTFMYLTQYFKKYPMEASKTSEFKETKETKGNTPKPKVAKAA